VVVTVKATPKAHASGGSALETPGGCIMSEEIIDLSSGRFLNRSAIKIHALECSQKFRAGKFTRVGEDFLLEVESDVEALIRELRNKYPVREPWPTLEIPEERCFHSGNLCAKLAAEMNNLIGRLIQLKVQRQPSCGVTLGRTR
jgi:hypothetical protein